MEPSELLELRKKAKCSRFELADRLEVTYSQIQRWEEGRSQITAEAAGRIRLALVAMTREVHEATATRAGLAS
jgi:transcriptional regulator with XRE-family HTH domain